MASIMQRKTFAFADEYTHNLKLVVCMRNCWQHGRQKGGKMADRTGGDWKRRSKKDEEKHDCKTLEEILKYHDCRHLKSFWNIWILHVGKARKVLQESSMAPWSIGLCLFIILLEDTYTFQGTYRLMYKRPFARSKSSFLTKTCIFPCLCSRTACDAMQCVSILRRCKHLPRRVWHIRSWIWV